MQQNINQHILTFEKGVTNLTPDLTCTDSELQDCVGLSFHDEALRPIQNTAQMGISVSGKLLFVHEKSSGKNYIYYNSTDYKLYAVNESGTAINFEAKTGSTIPGITSVPCVKSIGNTIIVNTTSGMLYFLWKGDKYLYIGDSIPAPQFEFALSRDGYNWKGDTAKYKDINKLSRLRISGIISAHNENFAGRWYKDDDNTIKTCNFPGEPSLSGNTYYYNCYYEGRIASYKASVENLFSGLYAEGKKKAHENKAFVNPFSAVCAVKLYDGSYTHISNPVLLFPNTKGAFNSFNYDDYQYGLTSSCFLLCKQLVDYSQWSDIVSDISVFVSPEVEILDTKEVKTYALYDNAQCAQNDNTMIYVLQGRWYQGYVDKFAKHTQISHNNNKESEFTSVTQDMLSPNTDLGANYFECVPYTKRLESEVMEELVTNSSFFHVCDIGVNAISDFISTEKYIKSHVLENLTTQKSLQNIDYYSFCKLMPGSIDTLNRRLNLVDTKRSFFDGFKHFCAYQLNEPFSTQICVDHFYTVIVKINTPSGEKEVEHGFTSKEIFWNGMFFYYPDPRAKFVTIKHGLGNSKITILDNVALKEHPGLNGAYFVGEYLPSGSEHVGGIETGTESHNDVPAEPLQNYLLQSEVDNPFVFNASGYVRVGQGNIIGVSALTTALNQDAYKIATTIVFTTQGIWALKINDEGQYSSVNPPFSREVCVNPDTITMVDNGVFFVSEKGLMLIDDNGIRCVSSQLNGKSTTLSGSSSPESFMDFARNCIGAYDYRDSQLWLVNNEKVGNNYKYDYHWVYNIKSNTFSRKKDNRHYTSVVTDYPDTLLQSGADNSIYSMINEPNINSDSNKYDATIITRPLKMDGSIIQKSICQIKHLIEPDIAIKKTSAEYNSATTKALMLQIYGSNDLKTWTLLTSLRGKGYKFFRLNYSLKNLDATDTISGIVVQTQKRYTEKFV